MSPIKFLFITAYILLLTDITSSKVIQNNDNLPLINNSDVEIILCANKGEIRFTNTSESDANAGNTLPKQTPKRSTSNASNIGCNGALNYNLRGNYIVWSNISQIFVGPLNAKFKNSINVNANKLLIKANEVEKLSLDWIHDLLYFIDSGEIYVTNINDPSKLLILNSEDKSRYYATDIVVNPIESFIVWIQWDRKTLEFKILRTDQDGSNKKSLLERGYHGVDQVLFQPCCLTIDYDSRRIYFIDNKLQSLESISFDGTDREKHFQSPLLAKAHSLDIYDNYVYWANDEQNLVYRARKSGPVGNANVVKKADKNIDFFKILHQSRQPKSENRCYRNGCSQICLPSAVHQSRCICWPGVKQNCYDTHNSIIKLSNVETFKKDSNANATQSAANVKESTVIITESFSKQYPIYTFKCKSILDAKTNKTIKIDWFTDDGVRLTQKYKRSPILRNISTYGDILELRVSYPYVKQLKKFRCASSVLPNAIQAKYNVIVRQLPPNPIILSHSFTFAGIGSKVYLTLQIETPKVDPPIDKYRLVYRGHLQRAFIHQEYSVEFDAVATNNNSKNTIYVIQIDVDYEFTNLIAMQLYAHNGVGWSAPFIN